MRRVLLVTLVSLVLAAGSGVGVIAQSATPEATQSPAPTEMPPLTPTETLQPSSTPEPTPAPATATSTSAPTATVVTPTPVPPSPTPTRTAAAQAPTTCDFRFVDGFESGNLGAWSDAAGVVVQGGQVYQGAFAAEARSTGSAAGYARKDLACGTTDLFYRIRVKVVSKDGQTLYLLKVRSATNQTLAGLFLSGSGKLSYRNNNPTNDYSVAAKTVLTDGRWHDIQSHFSINGANGMIEVWLDGQPVPELTRTDDLGTTAVGRVQFGENATDRVFDATYDDVCVDSVRCSMDSPAPATATPSPAPTATVPPTSTPTLTPVPSPTATVPPTATATTAPTATSTATTVPTATAIPTAVVSCWSPFFDGFESGRLGSWPLTSGLTAQHNDVADGVWAVQGTSTTGTASYARRLLACDQTNLYMRVRFKIVSKDTTSLFLVKFRTGNADAPIAGIYVNGQGRLAYKSDMAGIDVISTSASVSLNAWHTLQFRVDVTGRAIEVWYDGALVPDLTRTGQYFGTSPIGRAQIGENAPAHSFDFRVDDVCVDLVACADPATPTPTATPSPTATVSPTATSSPTALPSPSATSTQTSCIGFLDGFEAGTMAAWSPVVNVTAQQSEAANGSFAARGTSPDSSGTKITAYARKALGCASADAYGRVLFKNMTPPGQANAVNVLKFRTAADGSIGGIFISDQDKLAHRSDISPGDTRYSPVTVTRQVWHEVQFHYTIRGTDASVADDSLEVWFDGVSVPALTFGPGTTNGAINLGTLPIGRVQLGENQANKILDFAYDDVCVDAAPCPTVRIPVPPTPTPSPTKTPVPTPTPSGGPPAVIMAAGDIACGATSTGATCKQKATSDLMAAQPPDAVLLLGDNQYECGDLADFNAFFDPTWGRVKNKIRPVIGNHEYHGNDCLGPTDNGAQGYWNYFGDASNPREPGCADHCDGYYSYDLGDWHIVALNSICGQAGGCGPSSPQEQWLRADLAAHPNTCTLAYMHYPLFSSGEIGNMPGSQSLWQILYDAGADVVLAGHDHDYERFDPQSPAGALDPAFGIREFVVGTGGRNVSRQGTVKPNSVVRNFNTFGVLKMTLRLSGYDWQFIPIAGQTFTDSGSASCHGAPTGQASTGFSSGTTVTAGRPDDKQPMWRHLWLAIALVAFAGLAAGRLSRRIAVRRLVTTRGWAKAEAAFVRDDHPRQGVATLASRKVRALTE